MPKLYSDPGLVALLAGALLPLSFSPVNLWILALPSVAVFYAVLRDATPRRALSLGWCFGVGAFGVGASWVYVSIHDYGNAPPLLAGLITLLFIAGIALFFSAQAWLWRRWLPHHAITGFVASWVLGEWFRSWFLTGFPWLYLGYAHVTTPLAGLAPIIGVLGIGAVVAGSGALLGAMALQLRAQGSARQLANGRLPQVLLALWLAAILPNTLTWVEPAGGATLDVALVQANIPQELKFDPAARDANLRRQIDLSDPLWGADLVIWSETAIPLLYDNALPLLEGLAARANASDTTLLTGIFASTGAGIHNSIAALGDGAGIWHKRKLVPFGEYTPLRGFAGPVLELFALPMSSLVPGPRDQGLLRAGDIGIAPFICYEIVYGEFVRRHARSADLLVTVSNDTWFGSSWGPHQHLQMAAMRALENGRPLARATNNGITALIDAHGNIVARAPQFEAATLRGTVQLMQGRTPWSLWGDLPLLALCVLLLALNFYQIRTRSPQAGSSK